MIELIAEWMMTLAYYLKRWAISIRPSHRCLTMLTGVQCIRHIKHYGKCMVDVNDTTMHFSVPYEAVEQAREFSRKHTHQGVYRGAIGGGPVFSFMGTSIGMITTITCSLCNVKEDISGDL